MNVIINYPQTENGKETLLKNLATFKAELFFKSIEDLNVEDNIKEEVLKKVIEILEDKSIDACI